MRFKGGSHYYPDLNRNRKHMPRSKGWCFTINNYTEEDEKEVQALADHEHRKYLVAGKEVAPKTGTPHIQGYCYLNVEKSRDNLSKKLTRARLEPAKGSAEDNYNYCSKQELWLEVGTRPISSKRKGENEKERWAKARKACVEGDFDSVPHDIYIRHLTNCHKIASMHQKLPSNLDETCGFWIHGPSGTGKTTQVNKIAPKAYLKACNKWWDGYDGQDDVIIEDFDKVHKVMAHHLKIWADWKAFPAETKGGTLSIRPKRIIITSNYHPRDIWDPQEEHASYFPVMERFVLTEMKGVSLRTPRQPLF